MLRTIDDFYTWSATEDVKQTLFVPSASFLASLSDHHRTFVTSEPGMMRKVRTFCLTNKSGVKLLQTLRRVKVRIYLQTYYL